MENAACVTFLDDYVFRSKVTDAPVRAPRRDDPARAGAHVVRRPGHHALVGRPVAERVVRHRTCRIARQARGDRGSPTAWTTFANAEKTWAYRQDQLPSTHPIAADIPDLRGGRGQLRRHHLRQGRLGAEAAGGLRRAWTSSSPACRDYFSRHEFGNTTLADLLAALEETSGRDLTALVEGVAGDRRASTRCGRSSSWTTTGGTRRFAVAAATAPEPSPASRRRAPARARPADRDVAVGARPAEGTSWSAPTGSSSTSPARAPRCPSWSARPAGPGAGQRRRPDVREDPARRAVAGDPGRRLGDSPTRCPARCAGAPAWDMTRDAEMRARDYVELVLAGIDPETDIGVVQSLPVQVRSALVHYVDPAWRAAAGRRLADAGRALRAAAPGSDHQLAWAGRSPAPPGPASSSTSCAGCSTARRRVEGLAVDTDLRWALLSGGWSRSALPATTRSTPSWSATRPRPGSGTRRPRGRRGRPRRRRRRRGGGRRGRRAAERPAEAIIGGFLHPDQRELPGRTSSGTSR